MVGSAANATFSSILPLIDAELSKLYEDRNILLTDGGLITYTGTQLQFTENLNLTVNSRVAGGSPVIISLGSSTVTFANGDMWYAIINRTAGTATTAVASTLPAVTSSNQEVFLLAKRDDAGDGTQRVYFRSGMAMNSGQTVRLGSAGTGSGTTTGSGSDLDSLLFRASWIDRFPEPANGATSGINGSAGFTNATYNTSKTMYVINYDSSKTVTSVATAVTVSSAPTFTVAAGDVVFLPSTGEVKKITAISSQTSYTIESSFAINHAGAAAVISQAVHSKDVYNTAIDGVALAAAFGVLAFQEILIDYEDNATPGSNLWTPNVVPVIAYTASPNNSTWTVSNARVTNETDTLLSLTLPSAGTSLYVRFFSNKLSGSGTVNLLMYEAFMQRDAALAAGSLSIGPLNGQTANANGLAINGSAIYAQSASASFAGLVDTATQTFAGNKTFTGTISASNLSGTNTGDVTLAAVGAVPSANGASLSGQILTLQPADATHPGLITTGAQSIAGAKTFSGAISASNFSGSSSGTNTGDQTITLTGDVTGSGTGSFATTVAKIAGTTVSGTTGTGNVVFSNSPTLVSPALGTPSALIGTNITGSATNFTATNISATSNSTLTTLSALTTASSLASVGTITSGVWNGTAVTVANGGTGRTTLTNHGVLIGAGTTAITQLAVASTGTLLSGNSAADPSFTATPILGAVGTTGTLSFAGTTSGAVTIQPQAAAGTWNFNLPTSAGTAGQVLTSQGGGATAMTWGSGVVYRAGSQALTSGTTTQSVTFSSTLGTTGYAVYVQMVNTTDATPQFQPITVTTKTATGFSFKWNDPLDTANYSIDYNATVNL